MIVLSEKLKVGPKINPVCLPPPSTEADVSCSKVIKEGKAQWTCDNMCNKEQHP